MRTPWTGNWQCRLSDRLAGLGFDSAEAFVVAREAKTFEQLARELAPDVAAVQVEMMYLRECRDGGRLIEAAAECLARTIIERFPRGWGVGARLDYRVASALAAWISDMKHDIDQSELSGAVLDAVADAIQKTHSPPDGWLPKNGQDPLIQRAFEIGLRRHQP